MKSLNSQKSSQNGHTNPIIYIQVCEEGKIIEFNTPGRRYLENEKLSENLTLPGDHIKIIRRTIETGIPEKNVTLRSSEDSIVWDYYPVPEKNCVYMYGIPADFIKNGQVVSRESRNLFEYLYRAPDAIVVYDSSKRIQFANLRVATLLGYHYSELLGKSIDTLFPQEHLKLYPLLHENKKGEYSQQVYRPVKQKNGNIVEVETVEQTLPEDKFEIVLRDNSTDKYYNNELQKTIRREVYEKLFIQLRLFEHGEGMLMNLNRISLFLQNISKLHSNVVLHRFINVVKEYEKSVFPKLNSIGNLLIVLKSDRNPSQPKELSIPEGKSIIDHANKMRELLESVYRSIHERDEENKLEIISAHRKNIRTIIHDIKKDINHTMNYIERQFICQISEVVAMTINKYRSLDEDIVIRLSDELNGQSAIANDSEMSHVLEIILDNAIDALETMKPEVHDFKPCIDISLKVQNDKIRIVVKDNGPGIPKKYHSILFNDGFSTKGPGRGFGLSYAAECVRKYSGEVYYQEQQGNGACFVIELLMAK